MKSQRGFTLLEIIIALMIMSFLSLFTVEAIQRALKTKTKVQGDIDKNSTVRDALRVMERDINMAFNYHDPYIDLYNQAQDERKKRAQTKGAKGTPPPTPTPNPNPALPPTPNPNDPNANIDPNSFNHKTPKVVTQFLGGADALDFTALSNVRMMQDSPMSQQAEIGYKLKACRRRTNQEQSSNCLWRRVANYIHDDITRELDGQQTVLLENVTEFKLRYLGPGREEEWVTQWYTDDKGDAQTKGKFPYAVEITLTVKDTSGKTKDKELRMTTVAVIRNPNNPKDATTNGTDPNNPAGAPGADPAANPTAAPNGTGTPVTN